jgi:hypothetical protein
MNAMTYFTTIILLVVLATGCERQRNYQPGIGSEARAMSHSSMSEPLYSDQEAKNLVKAAEDVVPIGQSRSKREVFRLLNVDSRRFRDPRSYAMMNANVEKVQISENFDLTWMCAAHDKTPLESEERQIYGVRVVPREGKNDK